MLLAWALRRLERLDAEHAGPDEICVEIRKFLRLKKPQNIYSDPQIHPVQGKFVRPLQIRNND